jgi:hypothetical protein
MNTNRNDDILGFARRIQRYIREVRNSESAQVTEMTAADIRRIERYMDDASAYLDWASGSPRLDLPETHPDERPLPEPDAVPEVENPMAADIINLLTRLQGEVSRGQSCRQATGLHADDLARFRAIIEKVRLYLANYVASANPGDYPESSPQIAVVQQ